MIKFNNVRSNGVLPLLSLFTFMLVLLTTNQNIQYKNKAIETNKTDATQQTQALASQISQTLTNASQITLQAAKSLARCTPAQQNDASSRLCVIKQLRRSSQINDGFMGLGAAYRPYKADQQTRLFAPYLFLQNGAYRKSNLDLYYDYTLAPKLSKARDQHESYWFDALKKGLKSPSANGWWLAPYYETQSSRYIIKHGAAIPSEASDDPIGYAYTTVDLNQIQDLIRAVDFGSAGYTILLSPDNHLLYHSLTAMDNQRFDLKSKYPEVSLEGESGHFNIKSELTKRNAWLYYQKVSPTNWYLLTIVDTDTPQAKQAAPEQHFLDTVYSHAHEKKYLLLSYLALFIVSSFWLLAFFPKHPLQGYVAISLITSLLFLAAIFVTWHWQLNAIYQVEESETVMSNKADIDQLTQRYSTESLDRNRPPPIFIPTGSFIQSIEFQSAYNVNLTGYVWQKIPLNQVQNIEPGVIFPEAESTQLKQAYRYEEDGNLVIGWYFNALLRENFNYSRFPFDKQSVWIRFWPKSFGKNVVLIPDLSSYISINPSTKAGLEKDFVVAGWEISDSHFDIRFNGYNTNFGLSSVNGDHRTPELYFNVGMVRNFTNHFITNVFPIIVVLLMLLSILVTTSRGEHHISLLGFNASTVLASCSALFFVVLISHIELRSALEVNEIIYLEYFYLITYAVILLVSLNSIIFTWGLSIDFVQYKNNIIPKLLFGPVITGAMFLATFLTFN